jgi:hypothetical protein
MRKPPMAAVFRADLNRKVYTNPYVSGHCYFEAQALSNPLTAGMPQKTGARKTRLFYSLFYGSNMKNFWPLRTWICHVIEHQNPPDSTVVKLSLKI